MSKKSKKKKLTIAQIKKKLKMLEIHKLKKKAHLMLKNKRSVIINIKEKIKRKEKKHKKDYRSVDEV